MKRFAIITVMLLCQLVYGFGGMFPGHSVYVRDPYTADEVDALLDLIDYAFVTGNDVLTDILVTELETLSDGSDTGLHIHHQFYYTKDEVNNLVEGNTFDFFLNDTLSGIGAPEYFTMDATETGEGESTFADTITNDAFLIDSFVTSSTQPTFTDLVSGIYSLHVHADTTVGVNTKTTRLYWELYSRIADSPFTETLLLTSEESDVLTDSDTEYDMHGSLTTGVMLNETDRLLVKVYANIEDGDPPRNTDPLVTIRAEGTTFSHMEVVTNVTAFDDRYVFVTGDTMTGPLNMGTNDIPGVDNINMSGTLTIGTSTIAEDGGGDLIIVPAGGEVQIEGDLEVDKVTVAGTVVFDGMATTDISYGNPHLVVRLKDGENFKITNGDLDLDENDIINVTNFTMDGTFISGSAVLSETELEILDGATVTTTELNYNDGTTLGTATASNVLAVDSNLDLDTIHDLSITNDTTSKKYIESSLVGWYNFNAGTATDSSSFGNDGSLEGDASAVEDILELDGTGDYVDLGEDDILNFTDTEYFLKQSESGDMNSHQGVADDGTNLFTFDTATVYKRNRTSPYASVASETLANIITAAGGGLAGTNHLGDGVAFGNFVYVPLERWVNCGDNDTQHIVRLNKSDMTYSAHWDISAQNHEVAGITTDGTFLYIVSFCAVDGEKIWRYNIADGTYVGSDITLSGTTIANKQSITYNAANDSFYISSDTTDAIYKVSTSGVVGDIVYQNTPGQNFEGIDFTQDQMLLLSDEGAAEKIFFLNERAALSGFTISAWIRPTNVSGEHAIVARYNYTDTKRQYYLLIDGTTVTFRAGKASGTTVDVALKTDVVINTWQHVVGVCDFDNDLLTAYLNTSAGTPVAHTDTTVGFTQRVGIGQILDAAVTREFVGQMDDVRFYDRPLSVYEIERLYKDSNHNFAHFNTLRANHFFPRVVRQDGEPANGTGSTQIDDEEQLIWIDTNDSNKVYLMFNDNDNTQIVKIQLQ